MINLPIKSRVFLALLGTVLSWPAMAAMGSIATNYGLLPMDIASAQALSMFNDQVSATYYNPAYLAQDSRGEFTAGLLQAFHKLEAVNDGGSNPLPAGNDTVQNTPSQSNLIGMKTNLGALTTLGHPVYFGFMAGIEKYGLEMLAFNSKTSRQGQYLKYSRQPLFLTAGGATPIWRGIDAGFSTRVTLHSDAGLVAQTDLAGNTQYEQLNVNARPEIRPIASLNVDWGETICPAQNCWASGWETAFAYHMNASYQTAVSANTVIPGTIPSPGLTLQITTLDSYTPDILELGVEYKGDGIRASLAVEQQRWSGLTKDFNGDTIKDQAQVQFKDILVPRAGLEFDIGPHVHIVSGVAYQPSPLKSDQTLDVNYLDTNEWIAGIGVSADFPHVPLLAYPLRIDLGYQHHFLQRRDFPLTYSAAPNNPYETVTAKGSVDVLSSAITLKF